MSPFYVFMELMICKKLAVKEKSKKSKGLTRSMLSVIVIHYRNLTERVVQIGGFCHYGLSDRVYTLDQTNWQWTAIEGATYPIPTTRNKMTRLKDGTALVCGGLAGRLRIETGITAIFDGKTITKVGDMKAATMSFGLVTLHDGRVLALGGRTCNRFTISNIECFDPSLREWDYYGVYLPYEVEGASAVVLQDGRVLITGGCAKFDASDAYLQATNACIILDTNNNTFTTVRGMLSTRWAHSSVLLPDGDVLVIGGSRNGLYGSGELRTCEIYSVLNDTWTEAASTAEPWCSHHSVLAASYVVNVNGEDSTTRREEYYSLATRQWSFRSERAGPTMSGAAGCIRFDDNNLSSRGGVRTRRSERIKKKKIPAE